MPNDEEPQAELTITRSSSKDAGTGWTIRFIRRVEESDEDYTRRTIEKHRELEQELRGTE